MTDPITFKMFLTRYWETKGIREREVTAQSKTSLVVYTNEDRGDGVKWTPYDVGYNAFKTMEEALKYINTEWQTACRFHVLAIERVNDGYQRCLKGEK